LPQNINQDENDEEQEFCEGKYETLSQQKIFQN